MDDSFPVDLRFRDVPVGSTVRVQGTDTDFVYTTTNKAENLRAGQATMATGEMMVRLSIDSPDGTLICHDSTLVTATVEALPSDPLLPIATVAFNGHLGSTMYGNDFSVTVGRKFGGLASVGRSQLMPTWTVGVKASQMLTNWSDVAQLNLTETVEYGQIEEFTYVRGSIYLSLHRIIGLNLGAQLESDEYGAIYLTPRLGIGGFFGARYQ